VFADMAPGAVHGLMDGDAEVLVVHCMDGEENEREAEALVAMLYVFLVSHVVVICDVFFDVEWIRRLRILNEMRRSVQGPKNTLAHLVFAIEDPVMRLSNIASVLREYRGLADGNKLFRLADADASSLKALKQWYNRNNTSRHAVWLPCKIAGKRDLLEQARTLAANGAAAGAAASAAASPVAAKGPPMRRVVAACNCGQRQVVLRDPSEPALAPCCAEACIPLTSGALGASLWSLCAAGPERGPGFVDSVPNWLTQRGVSFGIEYECWAGHRFFLSESMAKVVMRLNHMDKLLGTDVPLFTKCLSCKQDSSDAPPAQLMRLHVQAQATAAQQQQLWLDPVVKFKLKTVAAVSAASSSSSTQQPSLPSSAPLSSSSSYTFRLPCGTVFLAGTSCFVLRLPRVYYAPDGSLLLQKDVSSPYAACLCASWLCRQ
jgi:hypothetical protein